MSLNYISIFPSHPLYWWTRNQTYSLYRYQNEYISRHKQQTIKRWVWALWVSSGACHISLRFLSLSLPSASGYQRDALFQRKFLKNEANLIITDELARTFKYLHTDTNTHTHTYTNLLTTIIRTCNLRKAFCLQTHNYAVRIACVRVRLCVCVEV